MLGSTRAVDMEMFSFGRRSGASADWVAPEEGFACTFNVRGDLSSFGVLVVGSRDLFIPPGDEVQGEAFDWEPPKSNRRDALLEQLFERSAPLVENVRSGQGIEHWRFFRVGAREPHVVYMSEGIMAE